jgi:pimeloyl-ACP methyl ester carboxylesterase
MGWSRARARRTFRVAFAAVLAALTLGVVVAQARATVRQPRQPVSGPGGSAYAHAGVRVTMGGSGANGWYVFEPTTPRPVSAPLVIVTHGYGEFSGYTSMSALIGHTVRTGNVVIYTRWQTGIATPCPGPFDIEPCMSSEATGIRGALAFLRGHPSRVQPQLERTSYFGFSFGGIVTANLASRYKQLELPRPRAIFLDDPHDGALTGFGEPALDASLAGIPSSTLVECHAGAEGVLSQPSQGGLAGSCNAVFPKLTSVPAKNKNIVLTSHDAHGAPALAAIHGVCAADSRPGASHDPVNAYDWGFCWKVFDALRSCAYAKVNCRYALGDTPEHRYIGTWSDGVPIIGLKVQNRAPIGPQPVPARQPAPKTKPTTDGAPDGRLTQVVQRRDRRVSLWGTASDDHGLAQVEVALIRTSGRRCSQMTAAGRFVDAPSCTGPTSFLPASGTKQWSVRPSRPLPRGDYRAFILVTDSAGQQPPRTPSKRFLIR